MSTSRTGLDSFIPDPEWKMGHPAYDWLPSYAVPVWISGCEKICKSSDESVSGYEKIRMALGSHGGKKERMEKMLRMKRDRADKEEMSDSDESEIYTVNNRTFKRTKDGRWVLVDL